MLTFDPSPLYRASQGAYGYVKRADLAVPNSNPPRKISVAVKELFMAGYEDGLEDIKRVSGRRSYGLAP